MRLEVLADDEDAEALAGVRIQAARTGQVGDGKVWIIPVDTLVRGEGTGTSTTCPTTSAARQSRPTDTVSRCASGRSVPSPPRSFADRISARATPLYSPAATTGTGRPTHGVSGGLVARSPVQSRHGEGPGAPQPAHAAPRKRLAAAAAT
ncbi:MAG: hypothetical protein J0I14_07760 [Propionibacteriaceae bacterium]|nr:hypothetical protein [Propionibacteriaceae bacterium]